MRSVLAIPRFAVAGVVAGAAVGATLLASAFETAGRVDHAMLMRGPSIVAQGPVEVIVGHVTPTNDEFNDMLRNPAFWAARRQGKSFSPTNVTVWSPKSGLGGPTDDPLVDVLPRERRRLFADTYRTVCVRLCDGSFVPVSFSTTRDRFGEDADTCAKSCTGGGARLFVHRNPGEEVEAMEDLNGNPYRDLPNAFVYKTRYDASCKCRPHPWEDAARDQHRIYALETQRAKGNRAVADELKALRNKQKAAEVDAKAQRKAEQIEKSARRKAANASGKSKSARPVVANSDRRDDDTVMITNGSQVTIVNGSGGSVTYRVAPLSR
jgi:hypothetical protein